MVTFEDSLKTSENLQESGEFSVALSDVLMAWKHLLLDKLHLPLYNDSSHQRTDIIRKEYTSFLKRTNTMDLIDIHSMYKQLKVDPEPLSSVQLFQFLSSNMETYEVRDSLSQVRLHQASQSHAAHRWFGQNIKCYIGSYRCATKVGKVVRRVFCSYLDQLVNSKNDMALAHTLDTPSRSLGRIAFTDLKREARSKNMSLFLAVTSFVRAVQLGGQGYAPAVSDPLRKHVKGLSDFVHFTDHLEEILGDNPNPSAGVRLVTSIREALLKGRASGDVVYAAADETARDLKERIAQIHLSHRLQSASGTGISPARVGRLKVLIVLLDEDAAGTRQSYSLRIRLSSMGRRGPACSHCSDPLRFPLAPLQNPCSTASRSDKINSNPRPESEPSDLFACTYQDDLELPLNRVLDFPSTIQGPTCVHPAPKRTLPTVESTSAQLPDSRVVVYPEAGRKEAQRGGTTRGVAAALGPRSGNDAPSSRAGRGGLKTNIQTEGSSKACKRKLVDCSEHCGSENQPPLKKPPTSVTSTKMSGKNGGAKGPSKKKLIAGQGKLTSFFRL